MTAPVERLTTVNCPLCHTPLPEATSQALLAGADWRCPRCDQMWNSTRLATVAAYAEYCAERAESGRRSA